jgi:hypothetical protein
LWNDVLLGFGNNAPGGGRGRQKRSRWHTVHPGRSWAKRLPEGDYTSEQLLEMIARRKRGIS